MIVRSHSVNRSNQRTESRRKTDLLTVDNFSQNTEKSDHSFYAFLFMNICGFHKFQLYCNFTKVVHNKDKYKIKTISQNFTVVNKLYTSNL